MALRLLSLLLLIAAALAVGAPALGRALPPGDWLVYTDRLPGESAHRLMLADAGRGAAVPLLRSARIHALAASADGRWLAYTADAPTTDLYLFDLVALRERRLTTDAAVESSPIFSPDGRQIAYVSALPAQSSDLWVVELTAETPRRVASGRAAKSQIAWSAAGDRLAYVSEADAMTTRIWSVTASGGAPPQRITVGRGQFVCPHWGPGDDLRYFEIVYAWDWVLRRADETRDAEPPLLGAHIGAHCPVWSPDGRLVTLNLASRARGLRMLLARLEPASGDRLTLADNLFNPLLAAWSPDGRRLAYTGHLGRETAHIFLVSAQGQALARLPALTAEEAISLIWLPPWRAS